MFSLRTIVSLVMLLVVFVSTCGVPLVYHYCADELDSISLATASSCGCGEHEDDEDSCCKDEVELHKVESESLKAGHSLFLTEHVLTLVLPVLVHILEPVPSAERLFFPVPESPPPLADIPVRFRSLLI